MTSTSEWYERTTEHAIEFVRLGYRDIIEDDSSFRSMSFATDCLDTAIIIPAIRILKSHNAFNGNDVADGLAKFSGRVTGAEFGRRGSPILWLDFPYWTHQREGMDRNQRGEKISDESFAGLKEEARNLFVDTLLADDYGTHETLDRKLWFWWD